MRDITYFVDESGRFEPKRGAWPVGLRTVGGVLVPLAPSDAETVFGDAFRQTMKRLALTAEWGCIHARDFLHPPRLARRCLEVDTIPPGVRELAQRASSDPDASRRLGDMGARVLAALRHTVGEVLERLGGGILLVSEYGTPALREPFRGAWPYSRMADAASAEAPLGLFLRNSEPFRFHLVIASRDRGGKPAGPRSWVGMMVDRLGCRIEVAPDAPRVLPAEDHAGLQAADVVVHALGPGTEQAVLPRPESVARRTLAWVRTQTSWLIGPKAAAEATEHDGLDIHRAVRSLVGSFTSEREFRRQVERLGDLAKAPPFGVFPTAAETARWTATRLGEQRR